MDEVQNQRLVENAQEARELTLKNAVSITTIFKSISNSAANGNSSVGIYGYVSLEDKEILIREGFSISQIVDSIGITQLIIKWIE